jgi:hypothetical protein
MDAFKFTLGPYELFASTIGGVPLVLVACLLYNPAIALQEASSILQGNFSIQLALVFVLVSYILGGIVQGVTWKYFLFLCKLFKRDHRYFGSLLQDKARAMRAHNETASVETLGSKIASSTTLELEDKLVLLIQEKVGIPKKMSRLTPRLESYLKEHNRPSIITAESHQATHIMYRNLSFGLMLLGLTILINLFRVRSPFFETLALSSLSVGLSLVAFFRSLSFKKWHEREILLGFYFFACEDGQKRG